VIGALVSKSEEQRLQEKEAQQQAERLLGDIPFAWSAAVAFAKLAEMQEKVSECVSV
jgi:hypothetical protein